MSGLQIQQATVAVAQRLAEVYRSAYQENRQLGLPNEAESASEREVADWIQQNTVYVAKTDSEVIGGVRLAVTDPARVKLSRFGVCEKWKGKGVGSQSLDYAGKRVRHCGYSTI